jgi:hypothetical protein
MGMRWERYRRHVLRRSRVSLFVAVAVAVGIVVGIAWGWAALLIYAIFALIALAVGYGVKVSGKWWEDASRGRFQRRDR